MLRVTSRIAVYLGPTIDKRMVVEFYHLWLDFDGYHTFVFAQKERDTWCGEMWCWQSYQRCKGILTNIVHDVLEKQSSTTTSSHGAFIVTPCRMSMKDNLILS